MSTTGLLCSCGNLYTYYGGMYNYSHGTDVHSLAVLDLSAPGRWQDLTLLFLEAQQYHIDRHILQTSLRIFFPLTATKNSTTRCLHPRLAGSNNVQEPQLSTSQNASSSEYQASADIEHLYASGGHKDSLGALSSFLWVLYRRCPSRP